LNPHFSYSILSACGGLTQYGFALFKYYIGISFSPVKQKSDKFNPPGKQFCRIRAGSFTGAEPKIKSSLFADPQYCSGAEFGMLQPD
jgi:hypothetical protein